MFGNVRYIQSVSLLLWCLMALASWRSVAASSSPSSSSTTSSTSSYTSVRALDQSGHSIQLKHAREAAHRHGRLVVAAACQNDKNKYNGEDTSTAAGGTGGTVVVVSLGNRPMVHSITLPMTSSDSSSGGGMLALCCTGVKGDVNWLVMQVQQHVAKIWERYNHHPISSSSMAHFVARLLGSFNGDDADIEWQSGLRRSSGESSDQKDSSWARPLGIQTLLLSTMEDPYILMIEPSGRVLTTKKKKKGNDDASSSWWCAAMGKDSDAVNAKLQQKNSKEIFVDLDSLDASQLQEKLLALLLDTSDVSSSRKNDTIEFMVEILTQTGIERRVLKFRNGKEVASSIPLL
jgi:20S proteasome alpha/beta subunit